ncbi:MAG: protein translocase subunit SecF [Syntrophales bacterium]|nr:protein translocase subunit SecF [Syntrophales bacterium]
MEWIKPNINFDFVGKMKLAFRVSIALIVISIASIVWHGGLNYGIDFAGGTLIQIKFQQDPSPDRIRSAFRAIGLTDSVIQKIGEKEVVVRTAATQSDMRGLSDRIAESLASLQGRDTFEIRRVEVVGPKVGKDLTRKAILALVFSWIGMLVYIAWRFEFRYAVGGILALVHDTLIAIGSLSLLDKEFTLTIVAALLTIVGYSINDAIVVFDRIRENARKNVKQPLSEVINSSINETLSRTILTAFTVFLVLLALFFLGGAVIHDFAFVLLVGIVIGTYSSIFIASPIVLLFEKFKPARPRGKSR